MTNWYKDLRNLLEPKVPIFPIPVFSPPPWKFENSVQVNLDGFDLDLVAALLFQPRTAGIKLP